MQHYLIAHSYKLEIEKVAIGSVSWYVCPNSLPLVLASLKGVGSSPGSSISIQLLAYGL